MNQKWGFQLLGVFLVLFLISGIVVAVLQQGGKSGKTGAAPGSQAELVALRVRINRLEERLAQQATQASEEKLLMIRVLDASTSDFDAWSAIFAIIFCVRVMRTLIEHRPGVCK